MKKRRIMAKKLSKLEISQRMKLRIARRKRLRKIREQMDENLPYGVFFGGIYGSPLKFIGVIPAG